MRRSAPAVARNRAPLLDVLRRVLPPMGVLLEVASGSGEHAAYFAEALPGLVFQPSDIDEGARASIDAWCAELPNVRPALHVDALAEVWPVTTADAVLNVNMVHISPWAATLGLLRHASALLPAGAPLVMYGPYRREGVVTAPSNEEFDASLKSRNPAWGLRQVEDVAAEAEAVGLRLDEVVEMPANNLTLVYRRAR